MRVEKRSLTIKENPHMNYTPNTIKNASLEIADLLFIPHKLLNFLNNASSLEKTVSGRYIYCFQGTLVFEEKDLLCPDCGAKMHIHDVYQTTLCYLPIGGRLVMQQIPAAIKRSLVFFIFRQFFCLRTGSVRYKFYQRESGAIHFDPIFCVRAWTPRNIKIKAF